MATGITANEKFTADALTASIPNKDPHPAGSGKLELSYQNKIGYNEALKHINTEFVIATNDSIIERKIEKDSYVLSDNLYALHSILDSGTKVDLIYLDPPYNTGMGFHSRDLEHAYNDNQSDVAYIESMRRRLILMREVLSETGSIYLHIGHQMLFELKVVMDEVFGKRNFRSLITRRKCSSKNFTKHNYQNLNDYILFYTKTDRYTWNKPGQKPDQEWIEREYNKIDDRGRYKLVPIHAPGKRNGETGLPWRGMHPPAGKHWQYAPSKLDELDKIGEIYWSKNGNPRRKVYLTNDKLKPITDYWEDFRDAHHQSIAITGYPTEKNLEMLKLIIKASSNEGDLVLDPFCGSGTTLHAASDLNRHWIGIDQSITSLKTVIQRMRHGLKPMGDFLSKKETIPADLFGINKNFNIYIDAEFYEIESELIKSLVANS